MSMIWFHCRSHFFPFGLLHFESKCELNHLKISRRLSLPLFLYVYVCVRQRDFINFALNMDKLLFWQTNIGLWKTATFRCKEEGDKKVDENIIYTTKSKNGQCFFFWNWQTRHQKENATKRKDFIHYTWLCQLFVVQIKTSFQLL